jgi:hypothetical protein
MDNLLKLHIYLTRCHPITPVSLTRVCSQEQLHVRFSSHITYDGWHRRSVHQLRNLADPDKSYRRPFPNQRPIFGCLKKYGMASPPEPANSVVIITFGSRIAALGVRLILPYRGDAHA